MIFETLSEKHLDLLLKFELDNRDWFESVISPRENDFYTCAGVKSHIDDAILKMDLGTHYSGVLIKEGVIVARGNLKGVSTEDDYCEVGYRVAKNSVGKGYASQCLVELIQIANDRYSLKELAAQVLDNNPASKTVLEKQGFTAKCYTPNFVELHGKLFGCSTFKLSDLMNLKLR